MSPGESTAAGARTGRSRRGIGFRLEGPSRATTLVLAPSLGTTADSWDGLAARLAGRFRLLRVDHRGHGASLTPAGPWAVGDLGSDLVELLDELEVTRAALLGVSLGGMVAMWVAAHAPGRVSSLVLASTAPILGPPESWRERAGAARAGGVASLADTLLERWLSPERRAADPGLEDLLRSGLARCSDEGYARCCEAIAAMDQRSTLAAVVAPTLVVGGADDPVCPPATLVELATAIPGASLAVLAGARHLAHLDAPDHFADAVLGHLAGPQRERGSQTRGEVLGHAHVARRLGDAGSFGAGFEDLLTRFAWGEVWSRPGLDRRARSVATLASLAALGRLEQLALHVPAALRNGLSEDEVAEVLLQAALYCGLPAADAAFAVAARALGHDAAGPRGSAT